MDAFRLGKRDKNTSVSEEKTFSLKSACIPRAKRLPPPLLCIDNSRFTIRELYMEKEI